MKWDQKLADRLYAKATEDENGCWVWTGNINYGGYGRFMYNYQSQMAHRWSYELMVADIPDGLVLDHLCRNHACINPYHLDPVSSVENVRRGQPGQNAEWRRTGGATCLHGHQLTEDNVYVKPSGWIECRACRADQMKKFYQRKRGESD